jgi:hypothetical protein
MPEPIIVALIAFAGVLVQTFGPLFWKAYVLKMGGLQFQKIEEDENRATEPSDIDVFKSQVFFLAGTGDILIGLIFYGVINIPPHDRIEDTLFSLSFVFLIFYGGVNFTPFTDYYLPAFTRYGRYYAMLTSIAIPVYFVVCIIILGTKGAVPEIYAILFYVILFLHNLGVRTDLVWFRVRQPKRRRQR